MEARESIEAFSGTISKIVAALWMMFDAWVSSGKAMEVNPCIVPTWLIIGNCGYVDKIKN